MYRDPERLAPERGAEVLTGCGARDGAHQPEVGSGDHTVDERASGPAGRSGNAEGDHRREQLLNIIVVDDEHAEEASSFAFKERVSAPLLEDPHFREQLIERVAWAVADAEREDDGR
jgi:hypothetical protein